jgi:hypothetical protein
MYNYLCSICHNYINIKHNNILIMMKLNALLFKCLLNSPKAKYKVSTSKRRRQEVAQLVEALCYKPEGRGFDS